MAPLRSLIATHRGWLLLACVVALLARAAVPTGWMPLVDAVGVHLLPCSGSGPVASASPAIRAHAMAGMHHDHDGHHAPGVDHPCAFAGLTPAMETPPLAVPLPSDARTQVAAPLRALVSIGRGLAAPPPPQTGPPVLA